MKRKNLLFTVLFILFQVAVFAQSRVIKGVIKDSETKEGIPGVGVLVVGSSTATTTDVNGAYSITVEGEGKKLIFTYVGYANQTVSADKEVIDITLMPSSTVLNETVVTALGVSKEKKALGYSISEVSGDALRESGEANALEGLAAKAPGVQVNGSGGTPGASTKIQIRGTNSLFLDNTPLIVVDGVPIDNSVNNVSAGDNPYNQGLTGVNESNRGLDINPDDIASVSILKGAAAAALYGSRGANGAIIYTTKRGKEGKMAITYGTSIALDKVNKLPELQNRWAQGTIVAGVPKYNTMTYEPAPSFAQIKAGTGYSWGPLASTVGDKQVYDNVGNFFETGVTTNNDLSLTAGNESSTVRFSFGNTHQTGIIPNSKLDRKSVRVNVDHKLNKWLDAGAGINYTNTGSIKPQNGSNLSGIMLSLLRTPVSFDASNYMLNDVIQRQYFDTYDNPYFTTYKNPFSDENNRIMGNFFFNLKPIDNLTFTWRTGTDLYHTNNQQIFAVSSKGDDLNTGLGQINRTSIDYRSLYQDILAKYNKQITEDIGIGILAGYNFYYEQNSSVYARGRNLLIPGFYNFSNAAALYTSNSEQYKHSNAIVVDASLDYKRFLYLDIAGRNEWNTGFGRNGKSFFYPKADLSWVFSENIKSLPKWVSFGKARVSFASVGKAPGPYSTQTNFSTPTIADGWTNGLGFPYNGNPGFAISTILNDPAIKPEKTNEVEGGLDLRFLNSRITLDFTVYSRKTKDVLIRLPEAPSVGYNYKYTNFTSITNKGTEISLGIVPIKTKKFSWTAVFNWSKNVNSVGELPLGVTSITLENTFGDPNAVAIKGSPVGVIYGTAWLRNEKGQFLIGDDGIPILDPKPQIIGNPNPDWLAGINNILKYKNINFSFLWDIRRGGDIWNGTSQSLNTRGRSAASDDRGDGGANPMYTIDGVYGEGTLKPGQTNSTKVTAENYFKNYLGQGGPAENGIQDGGWFRLRSVNIGYRLELSTSEKKRFVQFIEFGISARNLLLFTKYTGVDPETSLTGAGSQVNGWDYFNNPNTKSYMFNFKVGI
jgi:TonB-linked SusC/RagA family outer membrane protein